jgi:hypothetical protein
MFDGEIKGGSETCMILNTFDLILIMCGATGAMMVLGSIWLLYLGAIKLGGSGAGHALEAEFKNQVKINVRNPALGLFALGLAFFGLALYFAKPEGGPLVVSGQIKISDIDGVIVKLKSEEWPITISSGGEIFTTIQPLERLSVVIDAPGYRPPKWFHQIKPHEAKNGRIEIDIPEFKLSSGTALSKPKLDNPPQLLLDR